MAASSELTHSQPDSARARSLAAVYGLLLRRWAEWARQRVVEIEAELAELKGDLSVWEQRLALRRERRRLLRSLAMESGGDD